MRGGVSDQKNSLLDSVLRALGINPVQFRWRWRRRREAMARWFRRTENRSRALTYEHKTCHSCGAPVDRDEKTCPRCSAPLAGLAASRAGRLAGLIIPEGATVYTTLIGIAIVAIFGAMVAQGGLEMLHAGSTESIKKQVLMALQLGANHVGYFDLERLCHDLRLEGLSALCPKYPHVHRLVTACFVHFGIFHFLFNIYALLQLGPMLEEIYGRSKFLVLFFACGVGGSAVSLWWHWDRPVGAAAGASGALFGLIGASLIYGWRAGGEYGRSLSSEMLKWGVFALLFGLVVQADNAAHIGGAAVGAAMALVVPDQRAASKVPAGVWTFLEVLCLLAIIGSFVALFVLDDPIYELFQRRWSKG